jgi:uracil phosphoribosyltransferase
MLATGGSGSEAVRQLKAAGAVNLTFVSLLAAPEGLERLHGDHPDLAIVVGAVDRQLNEKGYILPGLGDAGDRLFGTA